MCLTALMEVGFKLNTQKRGNIVLNVKYFLENCEVSTYRPPKHQSRRYVLGLLCESTIVKLVNKKHFIMLDRDLLCLL